MSGWKRTALLAFEALICFGPIGLVVLLGMLVFPFWAGMLVEHFSGDLDASNLDEGMPWALIWSMAMVVCGIVGLVGLIRLLILLSRPATVPRGTRLTGAMILFGVAGLLLFYWKGGGIPPLELEAIPALMIYWILPTFGIGHFLYLGRHALLSGFAVKPRTQNER